MQDLAKQLHIDKFEEIIAVGALYRPGPMEMIPSFINRKHGREPIEIDHPLMKDILAETYGIMVYQEQVMQIASRLPAIPLEKGMCCAARWEKKIEKRWPSSGKNSARALCKMGSMQHTSMRIFDKMEKFASYGFNKSHAAAYGYLDLCHSLFESQLSQRMDGGADDLRSRRSVKSRQIHPRMPSDGYCHSSARCQ